MISWYSDTIIETLIYLKNHELKCMGKEIFKVTTWGPWNKIFPGLVALSTMVEILWQNPFFVISESWQSQHLRVQGHRSRSDVCYIAVDTRDLACRVQQKALSLYFRVKDGHYHSEVFVCLSGITEAVDINYHFIITLWLTNNRVLK